MSLTAWLLVFLSGGLLLLVEQSRRRRRRLALPPGPPGLPVVGNVLDFPQSHYGAEFSKLAAKYGVSPCPRYGRYEANLLPLTRRSGVPRVIRAAHRGRQLPRCGDRSSGEEVGQLLRPSALGYV